MIIKQIRINGLRGFSQEQTLSLGIPNSKLGSGLTVIVGANNSGKSTIYEAFRAITQHSPPSISEGRRNKLVDSIKITIFDNEDKSLILETIAQKGSETSFIEKGISPTNLKFFTLPSRRTFSPFFSKSLWNREQYIQNAQLPPTRGGLIDNFAYRLFAIQKILKNLMKS
jgi:AAA15 family ATPase/GTPase